MTYEMINHARNILELPTHATGEKIKNQYRALMKRWHPDHCRDDKKKCEEMAKQITEAYRVIIEYCNSYKYSFERDEVEKHLSDDEWWRQRFGSDPIWGA